MPKFIAILYDNGYHAQTETGDSIPEVLTRFERGMTVDDLTWFSGVELEVSTETIFSWSPVKSDENLL